MTLLSIIIPLAPDEPLLADLQTDLACLPADIEIIFVGSEKSALTSLPVALADEQVRVITAPLGRASQMNAGTYAAKGEFIWFLHADSRLSDNCVNKLFVNIKNYPNSLLYFDLKFLKDATQLMRITQWGVLFRSRILKMPFGDQGFCISKDLFLRCGGYDENLPYGEDHVLVWQAIKSGVEVRSVKAILYTSARKYHTNGWLKTTWLHLTLWLKQAWPHWRELRNLRKKRQSS